MGEAVMSLKDNLPTAEQLEMELDAAIAELEETEWEKQP